MDNAKIIPTLAEADLLTPDKGKSGVFQGKCEAQLEFPLGVRGGAKNSFCVYVCRFNLVPPSDICPS